MRFFTDAPCFFDGCAELRASYERDMARITDSDGNCSDCGLGRLNLKYVPLVVEKLKAGGWAAVPPEKSKLEEWVDPVVKPGGDP